jgi:type I restriction enzyme, S subunit
VSELPKGWHASTLGDLCYKISDGSHNPPKASVVGKPMISARNIIDQKVTFDGCRLISDDEFDRENKRTNISIGDVLLTIVGTIGRAALVESLSRPFTTQRSVSVLKPTAAILPKYLLYCVLNPEFQKLMDSKASGTAQRGVYLRTLGELPIKVAPLNEQKRIVAKLDELLPKVEACKQRLEKIPTILKRFRQSVLAAAVSGKLTEEWRKERGADGYQDCDSLSFPLPNGWAVESTSQLFSFVTSGSRGWAKYYSDKGAIFIRIGNLEHDDVRLDLSDIQYVSPPKGAEGQRTKIMLDDILVSITADVGMIAHVDKDIGEAYINQHVSLARPNKDKILPRFLALYLTALNGGREQFKALQRGATKVGLGLDDIRNIWVALPSKEEQEEIVRRHDQIVQLVNERCDISKALKFVDKTRSSVLDWAFSGRLSSQDPTDEPASVLLDGIKSASLADSSGSKPKRRECSRNCVI